MIDKILAYVISLGIIGAGVGWIVVGMSSPLFTAMGAVSIGVGVASLAHELGQTHEGMALRYGTSPCLALVPTFGGL